MKKVMCFLLLTTPALAQQLPPVPLTDWRASLDYELGKLSMPRDAHAGIIGILQNYERQAQFEKAKEGAKRASDVDKRPENQATPP